MVILDLSIVNVALPSIQSSLNFSSADLQWVVDAYAIHVRELPDARRPRRRPFRPRRVFVAALVLFSITSLAGGFGAQQWPADRRAGRPGLQLARLMAASSLAIITSSFPPGPQLHRAIGSVGGDERRRAVPPGRCWAAVITQTLSWRWVLLINPPIGIAARSSRSRSSPIRRRSTSRVRPGRRRDADHRSDRVGLRRRQGGTDGLELVGGAGFPIIVGALLLAAFCVVETRNHLHPWCRSRS